MRVSADLYIQHAVQQDRRYTLNFHTGETKKLKHQQLISQQRNHSPGVLFPKNCFNTQFAANREADSRRAACWAFSGTNQMGFGLKV